MTNAAKRLDAELLQARWVLGRLGGEELVSQAVLALEQGFDGAALRQLAGLNKAATRDLGNLPERAFSEMGLMRSDRAHAISFLSSRAANLTNPLVFSLVQSFPGISMRWRGHLANWAGEPAGAYNDMAEFVHYVVEDLYEKNQADEIHRVFDTLETLFVNGDRATRDLLGFGFFETLQNFASWRPYGNEVFVQFLRPMSKQCWQEIRGQWKGKSNLMDVIKAERHRD
jgi:hypothetical protein